MFGKNSKQIMKCYKCSLWITLLSPVVTFSTRKRLTMGLIYQQSKSNNEPPWTNKISSRVVLIFFTWCSKLKRSYRSHHLLISTKQNFKQNFFWLKHIKKKIKYSTLYADTNIDRSILRTILPVSHTWQYFAYPNDHFKNIFAKFFFETIYLYFPILNITKYT